MNRRYNVLGVLQLRQALKADLELMFKNDVLQGKRFALFVDVCASILPSFLQREVIEDSVRHLAGEVCTVARIAELSWRLAGNIPRLRERWAVQPWRLQRRDEWMPMQVLSCRKARNNRNKIGALLGCKILCGSACSRMAFRWVSLKVCSVLAPSFGFSRFKRNSHTSTDRPYRDPAQFVNLWFCGLFTTEACNVDPGFLLPLRETDDGFVKPAVEIFPAYCREWNKALLAKRFRTDVKVFTCPIGMPQEFSCHQCFMGYSGAGATAKNNGNTLITACEAATHKLKWEQRLCGVCNNPNAWFDPELPGDVCIDCAVMRVYKDRD